MEVDVAVPWQNVEYGVEKTIDEQNETDEERAQQYTGSAVPLTQQHCLLENEATVNALQLEAARWRDSRYPL